MFALLQVKDQIVVTFFTVAVSGMGVAISVLWSRVTKCEEDRLELWRRIAKLEERS